MSLFSDARAWLPAQMETAAGVSVTYTPKDGTTPYTVTAVPGATRFRSEADGVRLEIGDRDYLVAVAELTHGTPELGDRITETIDGTAVTFEVQTPENGEKAWRYTDNRAQYRLHCKRIET